MHIRLQNIKKQERPLALKLADNVLADKEKPHGQHYGYGHWSSDRPERSLWVRKTKTGVTVRATYTAPATQQENEWCADCSDGYF
ncbi:hypothetical protein [Shimia abyssi]|uniref:Uncharacterized protein n=1 Tax=Shimia abyssi TaxID=1662395 RepID=A0A2P8F6W9_9RHOB|nr:hypothetical protein [Shimia abyssi]PSL17461.1 hypothetical protein CLV88_11724 [Shimia abyssi]